MSHEPSHVSRAGLKLEHALREFGVDPAGRVCADFGCNVGGFTDCLLQHGAARVYAIDTGYGVLAWRLRQDPRVIVMERTNALHAPFPSPPGRGVRGEGARSPSPPGRGVRGEGEPPSAPALASAPQKPPVPLHLLDPARDLRQRATDAEQLMWGMLRNRRLLNLKFRRQHPVDHYILDFYCDDERLAIELDGGQHNAQAARRHDQTRSTYLAAKGIRILRFWDHEVFQDTEAVLEAICAAVQGSAPRERFPSPPPPLPGGEGGGVDLITIDLGWTPQRLAIPAALRWLKPEGRIITLIKPHYELDDSERASLLVDGVLADDRAQSIFQRTLDSMPALGAEVLNMVRSPIRGGKSSKGRKDAGNIEFLALLKRA